MGTNTTVCSNIFNEELRMLRWKALSLITLLNSFLSAGKVLLSSVSLLSIFNRIPFQWNSNILATNSSVDNLYTKNSLPYLGIQKKMTKRVISKALSGSSVTFVM